jgi:uncharacterized protein HemY
MEGTMELFLDIAKWSSLSIIALLIMYILTRFISLAIFRSYYDMKIWFNEFKNKKGKENKDGF